MALRKARDSETDLSKQETLANEFPETLASKKRSFLKPKPANQAHMRARPPKHTK